MPLTINYGWSYPALSDPPHGPNQIQALAVAADASLLSVYNTLVASIASTATNLTQGETVGYWRRTTTSSNSTGAAVGVIRIDNMALKAGKIYIVRYACHPDSPGGASDNIKTHVTSNTAGLATTGSATLFNSSAFAVVGAMRAWNFVVAPGADATYSMMLCVTRNTGTGTTNLFADAARGTEMHVYEVGAFTASGTDI